MASAPTNLQECLAHHGQTFIFNNKKYAFCPAKNENFYDYAQHHSLEMSASNNSYIMQPASMIYELLKADGFSNVVCLDYSLLNVYETQFEESLLTYIMENISTPFAYFGNDINSKNSVGKTVDIYEFIAFKDRDELAKFVLIYGEYVTFIE